MDAKYRNRQFSQTWVILNSASLKTKIQTLNIDSDSSVCRIDSFRFRPRKKVRVSFLTPIRLKANDRRMPPPASGLAKDSTSESVPEVGHRWKVLQILKFCCDVVSDTANELFFTSILCAGVTHIVLQKSTNCAPPYGAFQHLPKPCLLSSVISRSTHQWWLGSNKMLLLVLISFAQMPHIGEFRYYEWTGHLYCVMDDRDWLLVALHYRIPRRIVQCTFYAPSCCHMSAKNGQNNEMINRKGL